MTTDREFLETSLLWPQWPTLPVMRRSADGPDDESCGFLFSYYREALPIVYFGNIFDLNSAAEKVKARTGKVGVTWREILKEFKSREYPSLDAVLEAYRID